jgi:hypothetical protein
MVTIHIFLGCYYTVSRPKSRALALVATGLNPPLLPRAPCQEEADAVARVARQFRHPRHARPYHERCCRPSSAPPQTPSLAPQPPRPPRPRRYAREPWPSGSRSASATSPDAMRGNDNHAAPHPPQPPRSATRRARVVCRHRWVILLLSPFRPQQRRNADGEDTGHTRPQHPMKQSRFNFTKVDATLLPTVTGRSWGLLPHTVACCALPPPTLVVSFRSDHRCWLLSPTVRPSLVPRPNLPSIRFPVRFALISLLSSIKLWNESS